MIAWQPIDKAPKDGTKILILIYEFGYPSVQIVRWETDEEGNWQITEEGGTWACPFDNDDGACWEWGKNARYWMPLPEVPNSVEWTLNNPAGVTSKASQQDARAES